VNTKTLRGLKVSDKGEVVAVFATLNVVDLDGDVTKNGAFENGAAVKISAWNHGSWGSQMPVGRGTIREKGDEAILTGRFFLDTSAGRDTFNVVKESSDLIEWSYGYDIEQSSPGTVDGRSVQILEKLKVHEVSPVILGAGIDTRTLATKSSNPNRLEPWQKRALVLRTERLLDRANGFDLDTVAGRARAYQLAKDRVDAPKRAARAQLEERMKAYERLGHAEVVLRRLVE
jgi:HK97 family phage prohead protease